MSKDKQPKDPAEQGKEIKTAADLIQDEHNYRKHSDTNKARIKKSIDEAGLGRSVVIDADGVLVAGNGVQSVIDKDTPVRVVETDGTELVVVKRTDLHTGDPRRKTLALADNATADDVEWDFDAIAEDWTEDEAGEWGVEWPADEQEGKQQEAQEDDFDPDAKVETVCKKGDIWKLGNHRLMCGDSTDAGDVALLMDGKRADLLLTDPPYGIKVVTKKEATRQGVVGGGPLHFRQGIGGGGPLHFRQGISGGNIVNGGDYAPVIGDDTTDTAELSYHVGAQFTDEQIIFGGNYFTEFLPPKRCWIVWDKQNGDNDFADFELAWTSFDKSARIFRYLWNGLARAGSRDVEGVKRIHPTQKPVGLLVDIINKICPNIQSMLDLFGGSGTTLIAAEQLGRKCYMMELDPHYCDVIIARWEKLTGNKAEKLK